MSRKLTAALAAALIVLMSVGFVFHSPPARADDAPWTTAYTTTSFNNWVRGSWHGSTDNGELETYSPANVVPLDGGGVQLIAKKGSGRNSYTSGYVNSDGVLVVTPGVYLQATYQVPKGQGFWPAFWLWNTTNGRDVNELDISEIVSPDFFVTEGSIHANGGGSLKDRDKDYTSPTELSSGFHTYAMWWEPTFIDFIVDGIDYVHFTGNIPIDTMIVVFNLAVGGFWPGNPNSSTPFPSAMTIQSFTAWTHGAGTPATHPGLDNGYLPTPTPRPTNTPQPTRVPTMTPTPGRHHHR